MKTYKITIDPTTKQPLKFLLELVDGIPTGVQVHSELNQEYLTWLAEGNTPEPADEGAQ